MNNKVLIGIFFALMAAMLNASIGLISILLMNSGLSAEDIAFLKTFLAFLIVSLILFKTSSKKQKQMLNPRKKSTRLMLEVGVCAFLGIFTLFFFETIAYGYGSPPNVVVTLMASAALTALFLGALILKEKISLSAMCGSLLAICGITVISWKGNTNLYLFLNAMLAGFGYGSFTVMVKKYQLNGGIFLTKYLLFFGSIYLLVPFILNYQTISINLAMLVGIICLAVFPTILGFYCTTKALQYLSASKVQVTELSEPIFSAILTILFFKILPNSSFVFGAILIILGITLINEIKLKSFSSNFS